MLGSINIALAVITGPFLEITLVGVTTFFFGGSYLASNLLIG
jgi:hypothetical protein